MSTTVKSKSEYYELTPCPRCGVTCKPVKELKGKIVLFSKHYCDNGEEISPKFRDFKVDRQGEFIGPKE